MVEIEPPAGCSHVLDVGRHQSLRRGNASGEEVAVVHGVVRQRQAVEADAGHPIADVRGGLDRHHGRRAPLSSAFRRGSSGFRIADGEGTFQSPGERNEPSRLRGDITGVVALERLSLQRREKPSDPQRVIAVGVEGDEVLTRRDVPGADVGDDRLRCATGFMLLSIATSATLRLPCRLGGPLAATSSISCSALDQSGFSGTAASCAPQRRPQSVMSTDWATRSRPDLPIGPGRPGRSPRCRTLDTAFRTSAGRPPSTARWRASSWVLSQRLPDCRSVDDGDAAAGPLRLTRDDRRDLDHGIAHTAHANHPRNYTAPVPQRGEPSSEVGSNSAPVEPV
jgi:hypothetical protein